MLNVLNIIPYNFLPAKMGGQKCIALEYQFLSKLVNLTCATTVNNNSNEVEYELINVFSSSKLRYVNIFYFFSLRKIIKQKKISHLIIEHPYYGWLAILLKSFCNVKFIIRSQNIEAERFRSLNKWWWKILWHYEKLVHQSADLSFFITEFDMTYALANFKLNPTKCTIFTYGFELQQIPNIENKIAATKSIKERYFISADENILLFNGTLNYKANLNALDIILTQINPILLQQNLFKYKIIICGKNLPESYNDLSEYNAKNIIYAGFVNDIVEYYLATDIFINPVNEGGGIKTKIVEALGYNVSLVTTKSGAIGIPENIVGTKMKVIENEDWQGFANAITSINIHSNIPTTYFEHFYWGNIAKNAATAISSC